MRVLHRATPERLSAFLDDVFAILIRRRWGASIADGAFSSLPAP
jgi:hypothetical protein